MRNILINLSILRKCDGEQMFPKIFLISVFIVKENVYNEDISLHIKIILMYIQNNDPAD